MRAFIKVKKSEMIGLLDYIFLTLVIIMSGTMYVQVDLNFIPVNLFQIFTLVLAIGISVFRIKYLSKRFILWMTLVFSSFIIYSVCNIGFFKEGLRYVYLPLLVFSVYVYTVWKSKYSISIFTKLVNITVALSILSLFFYFAGSVLTIIKPTAYYSLQWSFLASVPSYYDLHFETMTIGNILGFKLIKNSGIFPEAPMFTYLLCFALGVQISILDKNIKKTMVLIVTIITTGTMTGFLTLLIIYALKILTTKIRSKLKFIIKFVFIVPAFILSAMIAFSMFLEKMTTVSYGTRLDHFVCSFLAFMKSGFMGVGISNHSDLLKYATVKQGLSVGLSVLFAEAGISIFFLIIYAIYRKLRCKQFDLLVVVFLILSTLTYVVFQMRFWLFFLLVFSECLFGGKTKQKM